MSVHSKTIYRTINRKKYALTWKVMNLDSTINGFEVQDMKVIVREKITGTVRSWVAKETGQLYTLYDNHQYDYKQDRPISRTSSKFIYLYDTYYSNSDDRHPDITEATKMIEAFKNKNFDSYLMELSL